MGLSQAQCLAEQPTRQADRADTGEELGCFILELQYIDIRPRVEGMVTPCHVPHEHLAGLICISPVTRNPKPCLFPLVLFSFGACVCCLATYRQRNWPRRTRRGGGFATWH